MNAKRTPSWLVYFVTLPFAFLCGMTFRSLLTGNEKLELMEQQRRTHQDLVKTYKESLKARDAIIQQLEQRLRDRSERNQAQ